MIITRLAAGALVLTLLVGSCAGGDASVGPVASTAGVPDALTSAAAKPESTATIQQRSTSKAGSAIASTSDPAVELSPLAKLVQPAGSLVPDPEAVTSAPQPIWIDIATIGVAKAEIRPVGVEPNGELEIPGPAEVGWYRWSSSPGDVGSAVLAAHVAYDGTDGVFRDLDGVNVGELVTIGYDDGSVSEFQIIERSQYRKDELPFDRIFAKDGDPVVALITCGGTFNPTLGSYEDNVVAYAVPT